MFRRFGSEVTLIDRGDRLIKRESEDVSAAVAAILEGEGVQLRLGAECLGFERRGKAVAATLECRDQEPEVVGSHLLLAVGRRPNTDDLGLDTTGIEVDGRGHIQRGRRPADQRAGGVGARRVQRPRRLYPHRLSRLRDRRRQPAARRPAAGDRPHRLLRPVHRPAARPRRHDRAAGARVGPPSPDRHPSHDPRRAGGGEERDPGLHEGAGGCGDRAHPRRRHPRRRRRRESSTRSWT